MEFLSHYDTLLKLYWYIAIPTSIFFLIQTIMTFAGADASEGLEADFDSNLDHGDAPFQIFSLRNLINFLLGFSWTGISFYNIITNKTLLIIVSLVVGILFLLMFFFIIKQLQKLAEDNSFNYSETINHNAEVYTKIPPEMSGKGKVLISIKGSVRELEAMTTFEELTQGTVVKIIRTDNNILIVEKLK